MTLQASINRAFNTSMEIGVLVTAQGSEGESTRRANTSYLTFVAIDDNGNRTQVPPVIPETADEKRRFDQALVRRDLRLRHRRSEEQ